MPENPLEARIVSRFILRFFGFLFSWLAIGSIMGLGVLAGVFYIYGRDLPDHAQLAKYEPPTLSRIYSGEGALMDEFARERRIFTSQGADLPREWAETLMHLAGRLGSEGKRILLIAFLNALLEVVPDAFPNKLGRIVRTKARDLSLPDQVEQRLTELLSLIKAQIGAGCRWGS